MKIPGTRRDIRQWRHPDKRGNIRQWEHQESMEISKKVGISEGVEKFVKNAHNRRIRIELSLQF